MIIKERAWIGANSIILPGVIIGENSVMGVQVVL
ncbi:DapH/DapD/GlmU-related protein [Aliarcobacter cryaerophilus]|nr:DapH/DapD/GlmU-related protein [Aliarcobacter cryaerophilus]